ncbi:MAG: hypothetical protein ACPL2N_07460, partial [Candidatus Cryosericum sp.]
IRPPAEAYARPVTPEALERAEQALGGAAPSGFEFGTFSIPAGEDPVEALVEICKRHPMRLDQVTRLLDAAGVQAAPVLRSLRADPRFVIEEYDGAEFFLVREEERPARP